MSIKLLFSVFFLFPLLSSAVDFGSTITGCEADDMLDALGDGERTWKGESVRIGIWSFTPTVTVFCQQGSCDFTYNNQIAMGRSIVETVPAPEMRGYNPSTGKTYGRAVVFTSKPNSGGVRREILGETATDLRKSILNDPRSFSANGIATMVYVHEDRMENIWIRIRTNYSCPQEDQCILDESVLVFIPYNETNECKEIPEIVPGS